MTVRIVPALVLSLILAGCAVVPPARQAPPPRPAPPVVPPPVPAGDWRDRPLTPGTWRYSPGAIASKAMFGSVDRPLLSIGCDRSSRRITLWAAANTGGNGLTIRTTYAARALPARAFDGGLAATLPATDPLLDQIAFSRGRFAVAPSGAAELVVPAWAEPSRVIEDCRG